MHKEVTDQQHITNAADISFQHADDSLFEYLEPATGNSFPERWLVSQAHK